MKQKSSELISKIKADLEKGKLSFTKIGEKYGISRQYISKVNKGLATPEIVKETIDPTNERILQLEARLLASKDEVSRLNKAYKASQRKNSIFEAIADELHTVVKPIPSLPKLPKPKTLDSKIKESCVLHLSDLHCDAVVEPHSVSGLEHFNFPIALRRGEQLVDTVIKFTQSTLVNYDFENLYIFANGDNVSGEIHGAVEHSYYRNAFKNALAAGQFHALMFRDLATIFPKIHVIYVSGNHGRRSLKKDYQSPLNNWDYLVAEVAKQHCANIKNIDFLIPESFSANVEVEGHGFCISHGDDIRSWGGLPWYGLTRKVNKWTALNASVNRKIKYYCFGHFHQASSVTNLDGEILINGAWIACDPYVYNNITSWGEPTQILHGVHHKNGISWRLHIKLRSDREHLGPSRYSVIL